MSKILKNKIEKQLKSLNVSNKTQLAFAKEIDKIISNKYQMMDKLNQIKNAISVNSKTISAVRKIIASNKKDIRDDKKESKDVALQNINRHLANVKTGFENKARSALSKVIKSIKGIREVKQLKINYKTKDIVAIKVDKNMSRKQIQDLGDEISKSMKSHRVDGSIGIAIKYQNQWAPAKFVTYGKSVNLYSGADSDAYYEESSYGSIEIYLSEGVFGSSGGTNENNDCLYNCLWYFLHDQIPWENDFQMKKALKIPVHDKVNISYMPRLEHLLNMSINITGDFIYTSSLNSNKIIDLFLLNEHFTIDYKKIDKKVYNVGTGERMPILYNKFTNVGYDGTEYRKLTRQEIDDSIHFKSCNILIKAGDKDKRNLKEQYDEFILEADIFLKETKSVINMYKSGNIPETALNLFDRYTHHIKNPPQIKQAEGNWIQDSKQGALIFAKTDNYIGQGYSYDVKSHYPSIMSSSMLFPIGEGEFKKISQDEFNGLAFYQYGIYRCHINGPKNYQFKINKRNKYTHIDLNEAKRLNLNITLICDDQPNFLYYSRDKLITGKELFKPYMDFVYDLKERKIVKSRRAKELLNVLWGKLSQLKVKLFRIEANPLEITNIDNNATIHTITPYNDGSRMIHVLKNDKMFKSSFARLAPFLLSKGREKIAKIIDPIQNIVLRCHTDGIICSEEPKNIKLGCKMGDLAFEGYKNKIQIKNCNEIIILNN